MLAQRQLPLKVFALRFPLCLNRRVVAMLCESSVALGSNTSCILENLLCLVCANPRTKTMWASASVGVTLSDS